VIKLKKIIFVILISFLFLEKVNSEISDALFMTVGNKPVLKSDIVNEIKLILILNNQSYSEDNREKLHEVAVKSTIRRVIKEIELERNNFYKFDENDFRSELNRLASNIYVDLDTLKNICESNELNFSNVENQVKTELYWNSLIFELYKNRLTINQEQIEERLKQIQNKKILQEYLISEIVIGGINKNDLESEISQLKQKIKNEGFENVAKNLSISESSINGGDLGWLKEDIISEKIKSTIINTPVGYLSEPIILSEAILLFKVRDKRKVETNISLEDMKNQLINTEKTKILNMHSLSHYDKVRRTITVKFYK
tara:strand:- start:282 stop:1220 length:939 start_codon:yes stop_codon:yes gene_type:complete